MQIIVTKADNYQRGLGVVGASVRSDSCNVAFSSPKPTRFFIINDVKKRKEIIVQDPTAENRSWANPIGTLDLAEVRKHRVYHLERLVNFLPHFCTSQDNFSRNED